MSTGVEIYINSGMLEAFVAGAATPAEEREILQLKEKHPEVREALFKLETDLEMLAQSMAIPAPPHIRDIISANIDEIIAREKAATPQDNRQQYIDVESRATHMHIHKAWKWAFAAVFILGKIFLATAIYFYLENRQAQLQIKQLKSNTEIVK